MKRIAFILAVFAALTLVVASADAAGIGPSQAPNIKVKNGESTNWAGYAVPASPGGVTDVVGTWTVPAVQCGSTSTTTTGTNVRAQVASNGKAGHGKPGSGSSSSYSSTWVGIDGDNSNTVEQIGTDQDCINGTPTYYAWYEMYPKFPVNNILQVKVGDTITGEVKYNGSQFVLSLTDNTTGRSYTTSQRARAQRSSAEWIVEAPYSGGVLPLADFGTVGFSGAQANINGSGLEPISSLPGYSSDDAITMVSSDGITIKAKPSKLASGGTAFDVTWYHQ